MFLWPADDGWPYPDPAPDWVDEAGEPDDDLLSLRIPSPHLFDDLDPIERQVIMSSFGIGGVPQRTLAELSVETGLSAAVLQARMGSGLAKLRAQLA